jgi:hypothetical protein
VVPRLLVPISFIQPSINDHFSGKRISAGIDRRHCLQLLGVITDGKCRENDEARMTKLEGMTKLKYDKHAIWLSSDSAFVVNDSFFIWISFEFVDSFFIRHSDFVIQSLKSRSAFKRNWRAFKPLATPNRDASLSRARSARDHS